VSRSNLEEPQLEQVKEMVKDGKDNSEIIDFMKSTYHVNVKKSTINSMRFNLKGAKKAAVVGDGKTKRHYKKRGFGKPMSSSSPRILESADPGVCRLKPICLHAEICVVEICRFRMEGGK
jgi:hypothetical protein